METLKLTRKVYDEGLEKINTATAGDRAYLDQFEIELPDGLNTASVMEICRVIQDSSFEGKVRLMRICIAGKNVKVKCPNGETERFRLGNAEDSIEGFDLFRKEPLALWAIADTIYGYVLKKSLRPSAPEPAKAETQTSGQ